VLKCVKFAKEEGVKEVMAITSSEGFFAACGFAYFTPDQRQALFARTNEA
jgi:N-acetylglutamate synthase-like GNAT family acetyltransferase